MESNSFEKFTNRSVASGFFARISSIIWRIVRISEVERFSFKAVQIFLKNFLDFGLDMIEKRGIINFNSFSNESYASVVLCDSDVTFLRKGKDATFRLFSFSL